MSDRPESRCLSLVREYIKAHPELFDNLSDQRIREYAFMLDAKRADLLTKASFANEVDKLVEVDIKRAQAQLRAQKAIDAATRAQARRWIKDPANGDFVEAMRDFVEGGALKPVAGGRLDVRGVQGALKSKYMGLWRRMTDKYRDDVLRGTYQREIYQSLDAIQQGIERPEGVPQEAWDIAQAVHTLQKAMFNDKKAFNSFLVARGDYLTKQNHFREKVIGDGSAEARARWINDAMTAFGDKSFPELSMNEKAAKFEAVFDRIEAGTWGSVVDDANSHLFVEGSSMGANIVRRQAQHRQLVARDWEAAYQYDQKYGHGNIERSMLAMMDRTAKEVPIIEKFTPNPHQFWHDLKNDVRNSLPREDQVRFDSAVPKLDAGFRTAMGYTNAPARNGYAKAAQMGLTTEWLAKAGGSFLRSFPDSALAAGAVRTLNGKTVFENTFDILGNYFTNFVSTEARHEALETVRVWAHTAHSEMFRNVGSDAQKPGMLADLGNKYGIVNLMNRHIEAAKSATGTVVLRELGKVSHLKFDALSERWQKGLKSFGIGADEWILVRRGAEDAPGVGKMLTPEAVENLPDEVVGQYLRAKGAVPDSVETIPKAILDQTRLRLGMRVSAMVNRFADIGSTSMGTRQLAFMTQGRDINDGWGAAYRLFGQFKSAAVTASDTYRMVWNSGAGSKADVSGVAQMAAMGMFLWSVGEYAKQALEGKTPEAPLTPSFLARAFVGSGAGGLFGDSIVQAMQRDGSYNMAVGFSQSLMGPAPGSAVEAGLLAADYGKKSVERGLPKYPNAQLARAVTNQIPMQNLFYTKAAFHYLFINGLKEFMGPGYLGTLEKHTRETPGLLDDRQRYFMMRPMESPQWQRNLLR
jgi:hypothetical protein